MSAQVVFTSPLSLVHTNGAAGGGDGDKEGGGDGEADGGGGDGETDGGGGNGGNGGAGGTQQYGL